jgi:uncharacterized protein (UPF0264 family)
MPAPARQIRFLASVKDEAEALLAVAGGADIIDCKDPGSGALGALPVATVAAVRGAVPGHIPVSATIGDLPCDASALTAAAHAMAATGVDYVKVGLFPGGDGHAAIADLGRAQTGGCRLVGVLFADLEPDLDLIGSMGSAGFAGVMLDTARKHGGPLTAHMPGAHLRSFIATARAAGLFAGLAGSLRLEHVAALRTLAPDVIGFRGALCAAGRRSGGLDATAVRSICRAVAGQTANAPSGGDLAEASAP